MFFYYDRYSFDDDYSISISFMLLCSYCNYILVYHYTDTDFNAVINLYLFIYYYYHYILLLLSLLDLLLPLVVKEYIALKTSTHRPAEAQHVPQFPPVA